MAVLEQDPDLGYRRGDVVAIAPTATAETLAGANGTASMLLARVTEAGSIDLGTLADHLVETFDVDPDRAFADVSRLVHQAQVSGALSMRTSWSQRVLHGVVLPTADLVMLPVRLGHPVRGMRREYAVPSVARVARSTASVQWTLALAAAVPILAVLWLFLLPPTPGVFVLSFVLPFVVAMTAAGVVHELAHLAVARGLGVRVRAMYRERSTVGLRRDPTTPGRELAITAAGPVAGLVVLVVALAWLATSPLESQPPVVTRTAVIAVLAAAALHLSCLLPPSADGRALAAALRGRRGLRA